MNPFKVVEEKLDNAIKMLDIPSSSRDDTWDTGEEKITIDVATKAYDIFLDASIEANHIMLASRTNCGSMLVGNMEIICDTCRALLLSCHLILALSLLDDRQDGVNLVDIEDECLKVTLGQTMRRCICILRFLSICYQNVKNNGHKKSIKQEHHYVLPPSRYDLLRTSYDAPGALILIDRDEYDDVFFNSFKRGEGDLTQASNDHDSLHEAFFPSRADLERE